MARGTLGHFRSTALTQATQKAIRDQAPLRAALAEKDSYELVAVHPHTDRGFVLVGKRRGIQYTLMAADTPHCVYTAKGRVIVTHKHEGHHRYSQVVHADEVGTKQYPDLDPICEAVLNKGWALQTIHMGLRLNPRHQMFPMCGYTLQGLQVKRKYTGERARYCITNVMKSWLIEHDEKLDWAIIIDYRPLEEAYRGGPFSLNIFVAVPQIYDNKKSMEALLKAIAGLPHTKDIHGLHPALVAAA